MSQSTQDAFLPSNVPFPDSPASSTGASQSVDSHYKEQGQGSKKQYICTFSDCQKIFRFRSEIKRHIASHTDFRPHTCTFPGCNKSFKRIEALEDHVRSRHTGEAPLTCTYPGCNLKFTTYAKLRYHTVLHGGEKPYKCCFEGCDRAFVTLSQLKQHERSSPVHKKSDTALTKRDQISDMSPNTPEDKDLNDMEKPMKKMSLSPSEATTDNDSSEPMTLQDKLTKFEDDTCQVQNKYMMESKNALIREEESPRMTQILLENENLKKKLELSQKLITLMKEQMDRFAAILPDEINKRAMLMYGPNYFLNNMNLQYPKLFH